jgi:hypothetical protein
MNIPRSLGIKPKFANSFYNALSTVALFTELDEYWKRSKESLVALSHYLFCKKFLSSTGSNMF